MHIKYIFKFAIDIKKKPSMHINNKNIMFKLKQER
jgi:hypothetical protein